MAHIHDQLAHFIQQRHTAYLWRKHGGPAPTDDILRMYRFCNLKRTLDAGTIALFKLYRDVPLGALPHVVLVARCVNHADTVHALLSVGAVGSPIGYVAQRAQDVLDARLQLRLPIRSQAYMATTHGHATPWAEFYAHQVWEDAWTNRHILNKPAGSLSLYAKRLRKLHGIGSFIGGQIIADLKEHMPWMMQLPDLDDFAVPGPGSKRGAALLNSDLTWHATVIQVRDWANKILASMGASYSVDAQDAQNILCEFEKYMRVVNGGTYKRKL
jgi:hypothetical protein